MNTRFIAISPQRSQSTKSGFDRTLLPSPANVYRRHVERFRQFGRRGTGLCPFHKEKTPSFSMELVKGMFYCFGCTAGGGDVIDFFCVKSGNPAFFAGFPSEVEKSAFGLFHGASFPQPLRRAFRFFYCAPPIIRIYGLSNIHFLSSSWSGSAPITLLSQMES